jgi:transcriptional regulator GlxA family with amidase domain
MSTPQKLWSTLLMGISLMLFILWQVFINFALAAQQSQMAAVGVTAYELSRTVLADRFAQLMGESPLAYLARWRLQLGARRLLTTNQKVLQVAYDVGYESEAAFSRAFRRAFGTPPARYRRERKADG